MSRKKITRKYNFDTISGNKLKEYYSSKDNDINPGEFPYTRGIHSSCLLYTSPSPRDS